MTDTFLFTGGIETIVSVAGQTSEDIKPHLSHQYVSEMEMMSRLKYQLFDLISN